MNLFHSHDWELCLCYQKSEQSRPILESRKKSSESSEGTGAFEDRTVKPSLALGNHFLSAKGSKIVLQKDDNRWYDV